MLSGRCSDPSSAGSAALSSILFLSEVRFQFFPCHLSAIGVHLSVGHMSLAIHSTTGAAYLGRPDAS